MKRLSLENLQLFVGEADKKYAAKSVLTALQGAVEGKAELLRPLRAMVLQTA